MNNIKEKGMWKRTFSLYTKFKIPYLLYIIQVILGIISTKIALLYVPFETDIKLGNFEDKSTIWKYIALVLLIAVVSFATTVPEFYASSIVNKRLQNKLINHSLHLPMNSLEDGASQIVSWITQDCSFADGLISAVVGFLTGVVSTFMSVRSMAGIDKSMLFIVPFILLYIIFSTYLEGKLMFKREKRGRLAVARLTAYMAEHLSFFIEIKQLHSSKDELLRGKDAIENYYKADIYQALLTLLNSFVSGSITDIITIIVFLFGVKGVNDGAMTIEELAAFQSYILIAYQSLSSFPGLYTSLMYYNGVLYYIASLMNEKEEINSGDEEISDADDIEFKNVSFAYDETNVLNNVSFSIPKGKVTLIVGPNGSGKSTVLKLLERFYVPQSGEITFGGQNINDFQLDKWRRKFGCVLQENQLIDSSIRQNICYGADTMIDESDVIAAAKLSGADKFIAEFEEGYDFEVGENGTRLSGGQKQKIAISRAALIKPQIMLLDEGTSNMDFYSSKQVMASLLEFMKNKSVVIICHDMNLLKIADYVVVLNNAEVEAEGETQQVISNSKTLKKLLEVANI